MNFLRTPIIARSVALSLLIVFVQSLFAPGIAQALTTGPHQPEYISYEDAGATDMVNLLTGDFTYNMPLLSVPIGAEGSFTVPLSYHAGIGPEQEASWVGLGWNINVGAITRSINGFPDDAYGETQTVHVQDLTGRRGWNANFLGTTMGWDSQVGHYGVVNLGMKIGYKNGGISSVGLAGLSVSGSGARFDGAEFVSFVMQTAMMISTYGVGSASSTLAADIAMDVGTRLTMDAITDDYTPQIQTQGFWKESKETDKDLFVTNYWVWLDKTRYEDMWGTLYLDKARTETLPDQAPALRVKQTINNVEEVVKRFEFVPNNTQLKGSASDININLLGSAEYKDDVSPFSLAYDNFSVKAPGISGSIKPYRLEVGSVSTPREMTPDHIRLAPVPFIDYPTKVPFVYEGSLGNRYFHHVGGSTNVTSPTFNFGIDGNKELKSGGQWYEPNNLRYTLNDVVFSNKRISDEVNEKRKIAQGNYIEWFTDEEIRNTSLGFSNSSYVDYFQGSMRNTFRQAFDFLGNRSFVSTNPSYDNLLHFSNVDVSTFFAPQNSVLINVTPLKADGRGGFYPDNTFYSGTATVQSVGTNSITIANASFTSAEKQAMSSAAAVSIQVVASRSLKSGKSIGGFVITGADGMNYHFALPVYDYKFKTEIIDKADAKKRSVISRTEPFANTWLLTAITGPDFVDRGGTNNAANGVIDDNDWGYWIKFNYGRHATDFEWRLPFNGYKRDAEDKFDNYATGFKEIYYLNSIETRSHVALFLKNNRSDSRGRNNRASLRLSEIDLITKDTYNQLIAAGLPSASGRIDFNYMVSDITGSRSTILQANVIRRIVLGNDNYTLCPGTPNSSAGKLTLHSISVYGKNGFKVFPDYNFQYGTNPAYDANAWDGWDMYKQGGSIAGNTHQASPSNADAWALTNITTPEGVNIEVAYERDSYGSVSGETPHNYYGNIGYSYNDIDAEWAYYGNQVKLLNVAPNFKVGEKLFVSGSVEYKTSPTGPVATKSFSSEQIISSISGSYITFTGPVGNLLGIESTNPPGYIDVITLYGGISTTYKYGGNTRVKSITLRDSGTKQMKTQYLYDINGNTTGVVSQEPDYVRSANYDFYNFVGYPVTPVLYGQVTVLSGRGTNDQDYHTREVFEFETPHKSQYERGEYILKNKEFIDEIHVDPGLTYRDYLTVAKHEIQKRTSKIGKVKSIKVYSGSDLYSVQNFQYTDKPKNSGVDNFQGIYTEGALMFDIVRGDKGFGTYHKAQRTTIIDYPWTLEKITTTRDGFTSEETNRSWDLITGSVLEKTYTDPIGLRVKNIIEPAYHKYAAMGSKVNNPAFKNMLTQIADSYSYKLDNSGNITGLIGATANVWKESWDNYRVINSIGDGYIDGDLAPNNSGVWRKAQQYIWKGSYSRLKSDGSQMLVNNDHIFNFSQPANNALWELVGSTDRYTHYSSALETSDINGMKSSVKLGYQEQLPLASASNAKYVEIAYSGAEDVVSQKLFGGEVGIGNGSIVSTSSHSGNNSLQLSSGTGFVFKSDGISPSKKYRASVWTNSTNGRIYYKLNGGPTEQLSAAPIEQKKIGSWYLLEFNNIPGGTSIEIGVKNNSTGVVLYDDFRFQPMDANMNCFVYDKVTQKVTHILNNDNLYDRFEYNDGGVLVRTFRESFKYGEKMISETKTNFKRFSVQ